MAKYNQKKKFYFPQSTWEPAKDMTQLVLFIKESKNMGKHSKYSVYKLSFFQLWRVVEGLSMN